MSQPTTQRPPQVTLASGIVMFSSVLVLATAWEQVAGLGSLETQEAIRAFISEPPFAALGLDANGAAQVLRVADMVAAACACATAILGFYVRKPDRAARLGLSVFAVPVFIAGVPSGGLAGSFVAAGTAMLWIVPAREWFATGRWTPPSSSADAARRPSPDARTPDLPPPPPHAWPAPPPAPRPYGQPTGPPVQAPPPPGSGGAPVAFPPAWRQRDLLLARPAAMVTAFVLTVVAAGGLLGTSLVAMAVAGLSPDLLQTMMEQQGAAAIDGDVSLGDVRRTVLAVGTAAVSWCVLALVLAGFAMARRDWARRGLMASAAFSAGACLVLSLTMPLVLIPAAAAVATVVCLRRVEVRRWFAVEAR